MKPVGDRVLVKVDKEEQKSIGGVLLPTAAQSRPTAGAVVAAGDVSLVKVRAEWLLAPAAAVAQWHRVKETLLDTHHLSTHPFDTVLVVRVCQRHVAALTNVCTASIELQLLYLCRSSPRLHCVTHFGGVRLIQHSVCPAALFYACTHLQQAGDHVVYSKFAGTDLDVAGEEHVLLKVRLGELGSAWGRS